MHESDFSHLAYEGMLISTCNIPSGNSNPEGVILSAGQLYAANADL